MKKVTVSISALVVAAFAPLALADIEVIYSVGGTNATCGPVAGAGPVNCASPVTVNGVQITGLTANSDSPGTGAVAFDTSATSTFNNTGSTAETIVINVLADGFTAPTAPPGGIIFFSGIGGSVTIGGANTLSYVSCINEGAGFSGPPACPATINSATLTPSITASSSSYNASTSSSISVLGAPYSINEMLTVVLARVRLSISARAPVWRSYRNRRV